MSILQNIVALSATSALVACATTTPTPTPFEPAVSGTAGEDAGVYSVTQDGVTTTLDGSPLSSPSSTLLELGFWRNANAGYVYETGDVLAIAGMTVATDATFAGISGALADSIPEAGTATYTGAYSATYYNELTTIAWNAHGEFVTDVDFGSGEIVGAGTGSEGSALNITGDIDGTNFNGSASFIADDSGGIATVPLTGGFYGTDTVAGIFQGESVVGLFHGANP